LRKWYLEINEVMERPSEKERERGERERWK
jgi:hypothetical protein